MSWTDSLVGEIERKIGIRIGQETGIGMLVIEALIGTIEIKVDHLVGIDIQDPLVDHLDIGIIEGTEIEIEIGIEIEIIGEIKVHQMKVMKGENLEVVQE